MLLGIIGFAGGCAVGALFKNQVVKIIDLVKGLIAKIGKKKD